MDGAMNTGTLALAGLGDQEATGLEADTDAEGGAARASAGVEPDLALVLHALSDPVRLRIVVLLGDGAEHTCGSIILPVTKSTSSHHFRVLREAGVIAQRIDGKNRFNRLCRAELDQHFPGLLDAVLGYYAE
jgi:DNA-binding transcriptional ArsR family regulator